MAPFLFWKEEITIIASLTSLKIFAFFTVEITVGTNKTVIVILRFQVSSTCYATRSVSIKDILVRNTFLANVVTKKITN